MQKIKKKEFMCERLSYNLHKTTKKKVISKTNMNTMKYEPQKSHIRSQQAGANLYNEKVEFFRHFFWVSDAVGCLRRMDG